MYLHVYTIHHNLHNLKIWVVSRVAFEKVVNMYKELLPGMYGQKNDWLLHTAPGAKKFFHTHPQARKVLLIAQIARLFIYWQGVHP